MTRYTRAVLPDVPLHIIQRGNNRNPCFFGRSDYQVYLSLLAAASRMSACKVHAYALMPNHVHILASPTCASAAASMMQRLGQRYVQYINRRYRRCGTLWQGRFRSCLVETERYFLVCQRYIELNPVRAGIVAHPVDYEWTSYKHHAHGEKHDLLTPHPTFTNIAQDALERQSRYRALCAEAIPQSFIDQVRDATNGNRFFGSEHFSDELAFKLDRFTRPQRAGRKSR